MDGLTYERQGHGQSGHFSKQRDHRYLHHYPAPTDSDMRRRAVQFHFNQTGTVWTDLATHRRLYRDAEGNYAGCTVAHGVLAAGGETPWPAGRGTPVVPVDDWD